MADLTERMNDIEALMVAHHTALYGRLEETNTKLDQIIDLLGAGTPDTGTLEGVIAAISAGNILLDDIKTRTGASAIYLDNVSLKTSQAAADITTLLSIMEAIRAAVSPVGETLPAETRSSIVWSLYRIMDAINPEWPRPVSMPIQPALGELYTAIGLLNAEIGTMGGNIQDIHNTMGLHTGGTENTIASLVRAQEMTLSSLYALLSDMGAPWPADVLAAIECVCEAASAALPIDPLDEAKQPTGCIAHYQSSGRYVVPAIAIGASGNIIVATWSEPAPAGLTFGSVFVLGVDHSELISSDWSQWWVFVRSSEQQYAENPLEFDRYPTNVWRQMSGYGSRSFSVDARGDIEVHLCYTNPFGLPVGECTEYTDDTLSNGHRAWLIPAGIPDDYAVSTSDNFYLYAEGNEYVGGPIGAGIVHTIGYYRATDAILFQFGHMPADAPVVITVCNPEPE